MKKSIWLILLIIKGVMVGCSGGQTGNEETPTSGEIYIAVDNSYKPILQSAIQVFESNYPKAKIHALYVSEAQAVDLLVKDSVRLAIVPRLYNEEEKKFFENIKIKPRATQIAVEGLAFIVHKQNPDTAIAYDKMLEILSGELTTWNKIGKNPTRKDSIMLVFDDPGSSLVSYVLDSINKGKPLPKRSFSAKTNEAVIQYISENKSALGIIPLAWISDPEDSTANKFLSTVEVVHIIGNDGEFRRPYLYYLQKREYPFIRDVFVLSREAKNGLGTGFVAFLAGKEGQRLIYKADLLPVNRPIRLIELQSKDLNELTK